MKMTIGMSLALASVLGLCSCSTISQDQAMIPLTCVVQAEPGTTYEVLLDGSLVGSGKATSSGMQAVNFAAKAGKHDLSVTAPAMAHYVKTIEATGAGINTQVFYVELKKQ